MTSAPLVLFVRLSRLCVYSSLFISMVVNIPVHGYAVTTHDTHLNSFNPSKNPAEVNICVYLSG